MFSAAHNRCLKRLFEAKFSLLALSLQNFVKSSESSNAVFGDQSKNVKGFFSYFQNVFIHSFSNIKHIDFIAATKKVYIWVIMPFNDHTSMYFNGLLVKNTHSIYI